MLDECQISLNDFTTTFSRLSGASLDMKIMEISPLTWIESKPVTRYLSYYWISDLNVISNFFLIHTLLLYIMDDFV